MKENEKLCDRPLPPPSDRLTSFVYEKDIFFFINFVTTHEILSACLLEHANNNTIVNDTARKVFAPRFDSVIEEPLVNFSPL